MAERAEPSSLHPERAIAAALHETAGLLQHFPAEQLQRVAKAAALMTESVRSGHKIIWFGNGGSATQSQHMAGEFVGRFRRERRSLPSISLTENIASLTAIGNDYAYEQIFSRQLQGLGQPGDVVVGLSTSGSSRNVIAGLETAREMGLVRVGLTGGSGGRMAVDLCDPCICVPSSVTARIQEVHLAIGHVLCELVEDALTAG
jgi:D-sedoheptulose 7-phosphate isomerase